MRIESEVKGDDSGNSDGATRDRSDKAFVAHAPAEKPVNGRAGERCKNYDTEEIRFHP
jgi:hypothetical protein